MVCKYDVATEISKYAIKKTRSEKCAKRTDFSPQCCVPAEGSTRRMLACKLSESEETTEEFYWLGFVKLLSNWSAETQ